MSKELSDKEIDEITDNIVDALRPIAAKLAGEKLPKRISKIDKSDFRELIRYFEDLSKKQTHLNSATLPKDFKTKQQIQLADQLFSDLFGLKSENPVGEMVEAFNPKIAYRKHCPSEEYATKMQNKIHQILYNIGKIGKIQQFTNLMNSVGEDTFYASFQSAERINKKIKYIMKNRKTFTKRITENYIEFYKEISGFFEISVILLYGLKLILKNDYKPFSEIRKNNPVGNIVKELKKEEPFLTLIDVYNPHIRNSVAHVTYHLDPLNKTIEFVDNKERVLMSFSEFISYVQEVTRRAMILCRIEYELSYLRFVEYKKQREKIIS